MQAKKIFLGNFSIKGLKCSSYVTSNNPALFLSLMSVSRFDNLEDFYAAEEKVRNKADAKVWDWKKKPDNED